MLAIVADESAEFGFCLKGAPRSLGILSREHPHGWGIAVFDQGRGWGITKQPLCAGDDPGFTSAAGGSRGELLVAHVRRRTVGPISIENTHPFERDGWVFAHNGTIEDVPYLMAGTSKARLAEVKGTTDSEFFFAYLLTHLDHAGGARRAPDQSIEAHVTSRDTRLRAVVTEFASRETFGACNFILSNGEELYAFRQGRTLHVLTRDPSDEVRGQRVSSETGAVLDTSWTARRRAVLVASERMTDEPWIPVAEKTLLKVSRRPRPDVTVLVAL